jgi:hypothetical protein
MARGHHRCNGLSTRALVDAAPAGIARRDRADLGRGHAQDAVDDISGNGPQPVPEPRSTASLPHTYTPPSSRKVKSRD